MSNVITSFLVGVGFEFDRKSADQIGSSIDSVKSKALQLGAVVAGAFGIKALTADFAESKAMLGQFAEVFGVTANDVQAFGNALATEGGTLESFMAQLESIERARARIKVGDVSFFAPAGKAGLNPNDIANAKTATDAYLAVSDAMKNATQQGRINIAESLGLDEASIRLLSQGRDAVEAIVAKYATIRPVTTDMTNSAIEFNRQWLEIQQNIGGAADQISNKLVPAINQSLDAVNNFAEKNRSEITRYASATGDALAAGLLGAIQGPLIIIQETIKDLKELSGSVTGFFSNTAESLGFSESQDSTKQQDNSGSWWAPKMWALPSDKEQDKSSEVQRDALGNEIQQPAPPLTPANTEVNLKLGEVPKVEPLSMLIRPKVEDVPPIKPITMEVNPELSDSPLFAFQAEDITKGMDYASQAVMDPVEYMQSVNVKEIVNTTRNEYSEQNPAQSQGQSRMAENKTTNVVQVNATLELDGAVIDRRVYKIVDGMAQTALDDLVSSTGA